jgi:Raf kinase inhibitor-like YbhB/YbcL family protein
MSFKIKTNAFINGGKTPETYTCKEEDISPPLEWEDVPSDTKSFVLVVDDPDTPFGTWNHWIIYNIPAKITQLRENITTLPKAAKYSKIVGVKRDIMVLVHKKRRTQVLF